MSTNSPQRINLNPSEAAAGVVPDTRRSRPLFFDGKFLTAADLNSELNYFLVRQADLARSLGFGVVDGLRVAVANQTASGVGSAAASLRISAGHGLTPAGEVVFLPADLTVDLSDAARLENLNAAFGLAQKPQQPFTELSGLFVVGLRPVEYTANPTPVFPPSLQGNQSLSDGEIIEATAVTLVPYDSAAGVGNPAQARTRAAREIFLNQTPPKLPADVLPLAMIFLRGGTLVWVDEFLVRREAGDDDRFGFGFAPRALAEAHFFHYQQLLATVPAPQRSGRLAAADFFEILPPGGPLPKGVVNLDDFTQAFFPPEARVDLTIVPEDELTRLMEESLDLPPLDLSLKPEDNDALAVLILAPVPRANYRAAVQRLTVLRPTLRNVAPSLLGQERPLQAITRLNDLLIAKKLAVNGALTSTPISGLDAPLADAAWASVLGQTPNLWYVRRRNLPYASDLAGRSVVAAPVTSSVSPRIDATPPTDATPPGAPTNVTVVTDSPATPTPTDAAPTSPTSPTDPTTPTTPVTPPFGGPVVHPPILVHPPIHLPIPEPPITVTPVLTTPVVTTPVVTPPITATPVVTAPVVSTPVASTPVVTTPVVTTPVVTTPVATTPVVTHPIVTTPVRPVITTPITTHPIATTPIATHPIVIRPVIRSAPKKALRKKSKR